MRAESRNLEARDPNIDGLSRMYVVICEPELNRRRLHQLRSSRRTERDLLCCEGEEREREREREREEVKELFGVCGIILLIYTMIVIYLKWVNKKTFQLFIFLFFFSLHFPLKKWKNKIKHQLKISLNVYLAGNQVLLNTKNVSYCHGLYYYYSQKSLFILYKLIYFKQNNRCWAYNDQHPLTIKILKAFKNFMSKD